MSGIDQCHRYFRRPHTGQCSPRKFLSGSFLQHMVQQNFCLIFSFFPPVHLFCEPHAFFLTFPVTAYTLDADAYLIFPVKKRDFFIVFRCRTVIVRQNDLFFRIKRFHQIVYIILKISLLELYCYHLFYSFHFYLQTFRSAQSHDLPDNVCLAERLS